MCESLLQCMQIPGLILKGNDFIGPISCSFCISKFAKKDLALNLMQGLFEENLPRQRFFIFLIILVTDTNIYMG